ncbi:two component transcriptional regulator, LuxR family protein [Calothrix sp. NIES-2100]|nr:two component transcriptional regulator, LuxR family protein [Calothrix sp. NIES-2100]
MTSIVFLLENDFEHLNVPTQVDVFSKSTINRAFTVVAQEVAGLLQHKYPPQVEGINPVKTMTYDCSQTVTIRAIEPKYKQIIDIELLTERQLEVLQLIVDGHSNSVIAGELYITTGTVKTHVRNILKKLCASDRTQAAIRALRFGLVH